MNFVVIWSYDNYIPAHLAMGRLEQEGIKSWLKDENTVTLDPILTNAVGGIKLMVAESRAKEAWELLTRLQEEFKATLACPRCNSTNIEKVSSPRKASNWISAIGTFLLSSFAIAAEKTYHCFNCSNEFETPVSVYPSTEDDSGFTS
ncbi:MAG TPA: DUF2007 domain-containing protein [Chitinophagaceae bacterium]|nr:DUF2007 domain-containing protein [Chitinophagaceae bacterium]